MCYAYLVSPSRYDHLDDLLTRVFTARQRPEWRRRVLDSTDSVRALSTVRVLRAVERRALSGRAASISDVADDLAVEHSTASRTVSTVVAAGLLTKSPAADDQRRSLLVLTDVGRKTLAQVTARRRDMVTAVVADWPDEQVDTLVTLLDRLADDFERGADA